VKIRDTIVKVHVPQLRRSTCPLTQIEARLAVFDFIEGWYNPRRRHSALDYESPTSYKRTRLAVG